MKSSQCNSRTGQRRGQGVTVSPRWAVVTDHPNALPRRLFVHGWYDTEDAADDASVRLVSDTSQNGVIAPSLAGLAIVSEDKLLKVGPDEYSWLTLPPEIR